ncbi:MAG: hypothetical protein GC202_10890 [Alphaproteobacteria bacterium]|nr:hypothetical protein [Alphaproteobacteria bacterium]
MASSIASIQPIGREQVSAWLCADRPTDEAVSIAPGTWLAFGDGVPGPGAIDLSDAYGGFIVTGAGALDVLMQGIALDLERAPAGFIGRARLGDIGVLLWRTDGGFVLRCERSYAEWLEGWLARAVRLSTGGT